MRIPKRYGQSKIVKCPFCGRQATSKNEQGIPVCSGHRSQALPDLKCACGSYIDLMGGKYGPYFKCMNCGNIPFSRAMEINGPITAKQHKSETVVRSDELDFI